MHQFSQWYFIGMLLLFRKWRSQLSCSASGISIRCGTSSECWVWKVIICRKGRQTQTNVSNCLVRVLLSATTAELGLMFIARVLVCWVWWVVCIWWCLHFYLLRGCSLLWSRSLKGCRFLGLACRPSANLFLWSVWTCLVTSDLLWSHYMKKFRDDII